jgi:hypothetical protein
MSMPHHCQMWTLIAAVAALATALAAQQQPSIIESSLCQQAREQAKKYPSETNRNTGLTGVVRYWKVDPSAWESDLTSLMTKSDMVVLAGMATRNVSDISPSGEDAIQSFEVKVLHTWKGDFNAGQSITFSIPAARLCSFSGMRRVRKRN